MQGVRFSFTFISVHFSDFLSLLELFRIWLDENPQFGHTTAYKEKDLRFSCYFRNSIVFWTKSTSMTTVFEIRSSEIAPTSIARFPSFVQNHFLINESVSPIISPSTSSVGWNGFVNHNPIAQLIYLWISVLHQVENDEMDIPGMSTQKESKVKNKSCWHEKSGFG